MTSFTSLTIPLLTLLGLMLTPAAAEPVLTQQPGQSNSGALTAFEEKLPDAQREDLNRALRWLARHHDYHFNQLVGMTSEQIIELAGRERAHLAAALKTADKAPERITFNPGAVEAVMTGMIAEHGPKNYVINAMAGQEMTVTVNPVTNFIGSAGADAVPGEPGEPPLILIIYGKDGTVLMTDHASSNTFTGKLPISEDYHIDVRNLTDTIGKYKLTVKIITPEKKTAASSPPESSPAVEAGTKKAVLSALSWQTRPLQPGEFEWHPNAQQEGALNIVVSLSQQEAFVYRGGVMIGRTTVSTGRKGHRTPTGVFHLLSKERMHHSNLYDNAPMPYAGRLTMGGVFLHAGVVPGYESSHGCVHLPYDFAKNLFGVIARGVPVVITNQPVLAGVDEPRKFRVLASEPPKK
ncbi:MAG: L,D-transpeptidase family protein [Verrucomicrobiota bacterium]